MEIITLILLGGVGFTAYKLFKEKKKNIGNTIDNGKKVVEEVYDTVGEKIKEIKETLLSTSGSYIFIGPPESGKTVFFITMVDRLLRLQIEKDMPYEMTFRTKETEDFITQMINEMAKSKWPLKTAKGNIYEVDITTRNVLFMKSNGILSFHDYGGEVFLDAFSGPEIGSESKFKEEAEAMKVEIKQAKGIFLVIDTVKLYNNMKEEKLLNCLFYLSDFLKKERNKNMRLAVIFTKSDQFIEKDSLFNPESIFKEKYPNAYVNFKNRNTRYFFVTAIKEPIIIDGKYMPPKNYKSTDSVNILEAAKWMLEIND